MSQWYPELPPRPLLFSFRPVPAGSVKGTRRAKISPLTQPGRSASSRRLRSGSEDEAEALGVSHSDYAAREMTGKVRPPAFIRRKIGDLEQAQVRESMTAGRSQTSPIEVSELGQPYIGSSRCLIRVTFIEH